MLFLPLTVGLGLGSPSAAVLLLCVPRMLLCAETCSEIKVPTLLKIRAKRVLAQMAKGHTTDCLHAHCWPCVQVCLGKGQICTWCTGHLESYRKIGEAVTSFAAESGLEDPLTLCSSKLGCSIS